MNSKRAAIRPTKRALRLRRPEDQEIILAMGHVCRHDFFSFAVRCFEQLMPGTSLLLNWHLEALAFYLEQVLSGKIKRLIINLPPRYGKSIFASVALPAFALGLNPSRRIIVASYALELAVKLSNDFRAIINSAFFRRLFPGTRVSRTKNTEYEIATTQGGFRLATSIDGTIIGRGGNLIIVDDPMKPSDALSKNKRERVSSLYHNNIFPRLDDKKNGAIIIVMQRLHVDDLCGRLLKESDEWTVLNLAAIAEEDEQIHIGEGRQYLRRAGEPLHPEREPKSVLDAIKSQLGSDIFAAQYQQRPIPPDGAMIKRDSISRYDELPARTASSYLLQSWDTAVKSGAQHDYSACVSLLVHNNNYYVADVLRGRFDFPTLIERARSQAKKYNPHTILVEDSGIGFALASNLKKTGLPAVAVKPEGDKLTRISIQSAKIEGKRLILPQQAPWLAELEAELFAFPNAPHDDQVDALSQALAYAEGQSYMWTDKALENYGRFVEALSFPF
jgi:predicted phage terminase large subunit-like protein